MGGKVYNKRTKNIRKLNAQNDFAFQYYYSLGEHNSNLEDRIGKFEIYIAPIIKRIDESENSLQLTGKELELLKLYCVLCGSRHSFTSEVITEDESGVYQSNNFLWGLHRASTQEEAVAVTEKIITDFEKIVALDDTIDSWIIPWVIDPKFVYTTFTIGLHITIVHSKTPMLCISDRFCIIENTLDSDFLYSYVPISPQTALFLVKSKYYIDVDTFENTKIRFGKSYGCETPDSYLSILLGCYKDYEVENSLFCSYYRVQSCVHVKETFITRNKASLVTVNINEFPKEIFRQYNSIFCEDGTKILFCDKEELDFALKHKLNCRKIEYRI